MKKFKFILSSFMAISMAFCMTGCSDDDGPDKPGIPDDPTIIQDYHFDLWVALDRHGGMGRGGETASGGQGWTVTFYPSRDNVGLAEILLGS